MNNKKRFLTRKQLAEITSKTVVTIDRWVARGWITPIKIGGSTLFDQDDVIEQIKKFSVNSQNISTKPVKNSEAA
jgi:predicted DNA-binding transcriptional regulator AlpA